MIVKLHRVVNAKTLVNRPPVINWHTIIPRRDVEAPTSQPAPYHNHQLLQIYLDFSCQLFLQSPLPLLYTSSTIERNTSKARQWRRGSLKDVDSVVTQRLNTLWKHTCTRSFVTIQLANCRLAISESIEALMLRLFRVHLGIKKIQQRL